MGSNKVVDLVGRRFGRWTVLRLDSIKHGAYWLCECDCGTTKVVAGSNLKNEQSKSCGCLRDEITRKTATRHGGSYGRLFSIWGHMKHRCTNENSHAYNNYGGRGIKVCDKWLKDAQYLYLALHYGKCEWVDKKIIDALRDEIEADIEKEAKLGSM